jgi:hypothetical protein
MVRVCVGGEAAVRTVKVSAMVAMALCALAAAPQASWAAPGPPSAPRTVTLVPGNGRVTVRWVAPFSNGGHKVVAYEVFVYQHDVRLAINLFHSAKLSEQITGLKNGNAYTFTVGARNSVGWSRLSARSPSVTVGTPVAPGKPTGVAATTSASLSWPAPSSDNGFSINGYRVTPFIAGAPGAARVFNSGRTHEVVAGLQRGRAYTFKVSAHNRNGWSDESVNSSVVVIGT